MAFVSLQALNPEFTSPAVSDRVIRHQNFLGELHRKVDLITERDREDATFDMRELGGNHVRFFAVNFPSHVLRHQDFRIKLSELRFDISAPSTSPSETPEHRLIREDSIFSRIPGLYKELFPPPTLPGFNGQGVSFQATNLPTTGGPFFIRHRDFHLFLEQQPFEPDEGDDLGHVQTNIASQFRLDATFFIIEPLVHEQFPRI